MAEAGVIVGLPVSDSPDRPPSPGATKLPCTRCEQLTWISGSGQLVLAKGADVLCSTCALPDVRESPWETRIAPGALEEVEAEYGPNARRAIEEMVRRTNAGRRRFPDGGETT